MTHQIFQLPPQQPLSAAGRVLPGAKLYFYLTTTTTPVNVWTTSALNVAHAVPVVADAGGEFATIYLDPTVTYKAILRDSNDVEQWTLDPVNDVILSQAILGQYLYPETAAETAVGADIENYGYPPGHAWRYLTVSQLADVQGFTFNVDVSTALQTCMDASFSGGYECYLPRGGYWLSGNTLVLPGESALRHTSFIMQGSGIGEIFARTMSGATIIRGTSTLLEYICDTANTGNGTAIIGHIRWEGNHTDYLIDLEAFYAQSRFHDCAVFNAGTGGGMNIELANTIQIHDTYIMNDDWGALPGTTRTGVGLRIASSLDSGLQMVRKCTFRGFETGLELGDGVNDMYATRVEHCECSTVTNGIVINDSVEGAIVDSCYFEGGDGGDGILNEGNYNKILNCTFLSTTSGFADLIDDSSSTNYGSLIQGNILSVGTAEDITCLRINSTSASAGYGKAVIANTFVFPGSGGSLENVVAIRKAGSNPRLNFIANIFDPSGSWAGGSGTTKVSDATTGNAYGISFVDDGSLEFPSLVHGVLSYGVGSTITESSISSNVLTLPAGNYHAITCSTSQTVNSITHAGPIGTPLILFLTNANTTVADTASIVLDGGTNFNPASSGLIYLIKSATGIFREISRASY